MTRMEAAELIRGECKVVESCFQRAASLRNVDQTMRTRRSCSDCCLQNEHLAAVLEAGRHPPLGITGCAYALFSCRCCD
jgi:hypothetical protein